MTDPGPPPRGPASRASHHAGIWIGSYGGGLRALRHDADQWSLGACFAAAGNASFGTYSPRHDIHYIVDERDAGTVGFYRAVKGIGAPDSAPSWTCVARVAVGGDAPCHIALDHSETRLAVANYATGSVSLFRLSDDGLPAAPADVFVHRGSGPNTERQSGPHAHWVGFDADDRWLYAVDLGTDEILAFATDAEAIDTPRIAYRAPAGSGPRHMVLHPRLLGIAYLANELTSALTLLSGGDGAFAARATMSTLPAGYDGPNIVAHIAMNAACDRLYVSNRGHDSIAVFALDAAGAPTLIQHAPAGAAYPRFFLIAQDHASLIVANEKDGCVTILPIESDGRLGASVAMLPVAGAAFALFA